MLSEINCPTCGAPHSKLEPVGPARFGTRCTVATCHRKFTVVVKNGAAGLRVLAGETQTDRIRNGARQINEDSPAYDYTELNKLTLADLRKLADSVEDFTEALCDSYDKDLERLKAYVRTRQRAAEANKESGQKQAAFAKEAKVTSSKAGNLKVDGDSASKAALRATYKTNLLTFLDMRLALGQISAAEATKLRSADLNILAEKLGLPKLSD